MLFNFTKNLHSRKFFKVFGVRGFYTLRKRKNRGYCIQVTPRTKQVHLGRFSIGIGDYYFAG